MAIRVSWVPAARVEALRARPPAVTSGFRQSTPTMPDPDSVVRIGGQFNCAVNDNTKYNMSQVTLQAVGSGVVS